MLVAHERNKFSDGIKTEVNCENLRVLFGGDITIAVQKYVYLKKEFT